jgi:hypothetical protein
VSLYAQGGNIDRDRLSELTGSAPVRMELPPLEEWLVEWVTRGGGYLDSLPGVMAHLTDAWRRRHDPNVVLVHYEDLSADLAGRMAALAGRLGLEPPTPDLVAAATFDRMRTRATELAPDVLGVLKSPEAFFRGGRSGAGREVLDAAGLAAYERRARELAPPGLLAWLHR